MKRLVALTIVMSVAFDCFRFLQYQSLRIMNNLEFVTPCIWRSISSYSEGLALVQEQDFNGYKGKMGIYG